MSSQETSEPHHADALRLLAELQCLLEDPSPATCSQAITAKWNLLGGSYYANAEFLESRKKEFDGSWDDEKPVRADRCEEKYIRSKDLLITATRDYSTHSRYTTSLGRQILALSGKHQQWERTFLLWQFELARADLDSIDRKCEKLRGTADKWEKRTRREDKKFVDHYMRFESHIDKFVELHQKMEEAEGKLKGFWARERWCKAENGLGREACAEEMRRLESWRYWPEGRVCEGVLIGECLVDHEHD